MPNDITIMLRTNIYSTRSPDLKKAFEIYVCGFVEKNSNTHAHNTKYTLKCAIDDVTYGITKEQLINACNSFTF